MASTADSPSTRSSTIADTNGGHPPDSELDKDAVDEKAAQHDENPQQESQSPSSEDEKPQRSKAKLTLIMVALGLACFLAALDITIVTTALPTITEAFSSETAYTWVGSSYLLAVASTTIVWGKLSDVFGRKPALLMANVVFFIGSLIAALAVNVTMLLFARAIQGVGGAGLNVLVNICIGDLFSPRERGAFYSVVAIVWALALSLGPIIGGALTEYVTWRWCFYINLPLDGVAFLLILFFLDLHTPRTPFLQGIGSIDWLGAALSVGGTLMFLFGLSFGGQRNPWDSPTVICQIVFGIVCWCVFFFYEARVAKYPLMPLDIFKNRASLALLGLCFIQSFVYISATYYLPLYFQAVLGATPLLSGAYIIPIAIPLSLTSIASGMYLRKTGNYRFPIWIGFVVMTLGFGLLIDLGPTANWALIILAQIVAGAGCGPNFQAPMIALQSLCPPRLIASATSCFAFVRMLSGGVSIVIGQVVFQNEMSKRQVQLMQVVGPELAQRLGGGSAGSQTDFIRGLPQVQRDAVHAVIASSLKNIWIMYTAVSAAALVVMLFVGKKTLTADHKETKTGLQAEEEARAERLAAQKVKKEAKAGNVEQKA